MCRFEEQEAPGSRSFFTEIIASISDIKFAKDGRHILSRDYMTLKVQCDVKEESVSIKTLAYSLLTQFFSLLSRNLLAVAY